MKDEDRLSGAIRFGRPKYRLNKPRSQLTAEDILGFISGKNQVITEIPDELVESDIFLPGMAKYIQSDLRELPKTQIASGGPDMHDKTQIGTGMRLGDPNNIIPQGRVDNIARMKLGNGNDTMKSDLISSRVTMKRGDSKNKPSSLGLKGRVLHVDPKFSADYDENKETDDEGKFAYEFKEDPSFPAELNTEAKEFNKTMSSLKDPSTMKQYLQLIAEHGDKKQIEELKAKLEASEDIKEADKLIGSVQNFNAIKDEIKILRENKLINKKADKDLVYSMLKMKTTIKPSDEQVEAFQQALNKNLAEKASKLGIVVLDINAKDLIDKDSDDIEHEILDKMFTELVGISPSIKIGDGRYIGDFIKSDKFKQKLYKDASDNVQYIRTEISNEVEKGQMSNDVAEKLNLTLSQVQAKYDHVVESLPETEAEEVKYSDKPTESAEEYDIASSGEKELVQSAEQLAQGLALVATQSPSKTQSAITALKKNIEKADIRSPSRDRSAAQKKSLAEEKHEISEEKQEIEQKEEQEIEQEIEQKEEQEIEQKGEVLIDPIMEQVKKINDEIKFNLDTTKFSARTASIVNEVSTNYNKLFAELSPDDKLMRLLQIRNDIDSVEILYNENVRPSGEGIGSGWLANVTESKKGEIQKTLKKIADRYGYDTSSVKTKFHAIETLYEILKNVPFGERIDILGPAREGGDIDD